MRSSWKKAFLDSFLLKKTFIKKIQKTYKIQKIWSRRSSIPGFLIGKKVLIHNGKNFKSVFITREMVGYKFGTFCKTRRFTLKLKSKK
jgi:small subunit ribosomal protein S19